VTAEHPDSLTQLMGLPALPILHALLRGIMGQLQSRARRAMLQVNAVSVSNTGSPPCIESHILSSALNAVAVSNCTPQQLAACWQSPRDSRLGGCNADADVHPLCAASGQEVLTSILSNPTLANFLASVASSTASPADPLALLRVVHAGGAPLYSLAQVRKHLVGVLVPCL
jgi:hypothetical protein